MQRKLQLDERASSGIFVRDTIFIFVSSLGIDPCKGGPVLTYIKKMSQNGKRERKDTKIGSFQLHWGAEKE